MKKECRGAEIKTLLESHRYGRYFEDPDLPYEATLNLVTDNVTDFLLRDDSMCITEETTLGILSGILIFRASNWDTLHFGQRTVIIESVIVQNKGSLEHTQIVERLVERFTIWCTDNKAGFIVAKISSLDLITVHCLEKHGFRFIESWVYYKIDLRKSVTSFQDVLKLRNAKHSDLDYMLEYSKDAFNTQRFHADSHISYAKAESLYTNWIRTSFKDPEQKILVYDHENSPTAFMIYYIKDLTNYYNLRFAMWKMLVINPATRGMGIGTNFLRSLCAYHYHEGMHVVDSGVSLRNTQSLNTHNKLNFKVISTLVTLHLWV